MLDGRTIEAALDWWRDAGVVSAEAEAILALPPPPSREQTAAGPAAQRPTPRPAVRTAQRSVVDDARLAAARAATLGELAAEIAAFEGCALRQTAKQMVFSDGVEGAPVMILGEAPGRDEDAAGKPFVGRSGQLLDRMFAAIGLDRATNLFISNVIYWRPPGNRPPTQGEIAACLPFVERTIELARPKILVLAGGVAAQVALKREEGVLKMRGKRMTTQIPAAGGPLNAMVILHPAYLLRRPQDKRLAWLDMQTLAAWADELGIERGTGF